MDIASMLGKEIANRRKALGLTLRRVEEIASELGYGVDNSQLARYERGRSMPSVEKLVILDHVLHLSFGQLLGLYRIHHARMRARIAAIGDGIANVRAGTEALVAARYTDAIVHYGHAERDDGRAGLEARLGTARALLHLGLPEASQGEVARLHSAIRGREEHRDLYTAGLLTGAAALEARDAFDLAKTTLWGIVHEASSSLESARAYRRLGDHFVLRAELGDAEAATEAMLSYTAADHAYREAPTDMRSERAELLLGLARAHALNGSSGRRTLELSRSLVQEAGLMPRYYATRALNERDPERSLMYAYQLPALIGARQEPYDRHDGVRLDALRVRWQHRPHAAVRRQIGTLLPMLHPRTASSRILERSLAA